MVEKAPELTPEEKIVIGELIERAERWDVRDNGIVNTIFRVVKDKREEEIVGKFYEWESEQMMLSYNEDKNTIEGKQEEEAWKIASNMKVTRIRKQINDLLNREKRGAVVRPNEKGGFGEGGVDRLEMLEELIKIAPNHPALTDEIAESLRERGA